MGVPQHLCTTCPGAQPFFWKNSIVSTDYRETKWFLIAKGVRQCYFFSAYNLYAEHIIWKAKLDSDQGRVKMDGRNINNFRYSDDILLAESKSDMKQVLMNEEQKQDYCSVLK